MATTTAWVITILGLLGVLAFDVLWAIKNRKKMTSTKEAGAWIIFYIVAAIVFGYYLGVWKSTQSREEFFAGWLTEYALSVDNIFVFVIILARTRVEKEKQQLVLLIGILLTILIRALFIPGGAVLISKFSSIFFIFGAFLIYTAYQLFIESADEEKEWKEGKLVTALRNRGASTFKIALVALAVTNIVFSLDSIPAIFGLTKDAYVVTTANIFALMGLRQLYFLIGGLLQRLIYLSKGLSIILGFIGVKLIFEAFHGVGVDEILGVHIPEITLAVSLSVIAASLAVTTAVSLSVTRSAKKTDEEE